MGALPCYGVQADWRLLCAEVEKHTQLRYTEMQNSPSPETREYLEAANIPALGIADRATGSVCRSYLVTRRTTQVAPRHIRDTSGEVRTCIDQLNNPDSVTLTAAGEWDGIILAGRVATTSSTVLSRSLMNAFSKACRLHFTKVRAFWMGPEALVHFRGGTRCTISALSPPQFDLVP